jgi:hypothetical protein
MEPGIFEAKSVNEPEKRFLFSAVDGFETWKIHFDILMKGKHPNKRLQDHLKKDPSDEFSVRLLFACNKNEMVYYTKHFIDQMKPYFNQKSKAKK